MVYIVNRVIDVLNLLGYRCLEPYHIGLNREGCGKVMRSFLLFQGSPAAKRDHFYGVLTSRFGEAGLPIPRLTRRDCGFPH